MVFKVLPVIDIMIDLYKQPLSIDRFQAYIKLLQGETKGNLAFPISGFNPMAKEHILEKLRELKNLEAEKNMTEALSALNDKVSGQFSNRSFHVALNLSDDLKGGWTNRFTSDYDSKFNFNGLISRDFCTPIFWSSENYSKTIIKQRTLEYALRTIYRLTYPGPRTLEEHVLQERYVANTVGIKNKYVMGDFAELNNFFVVNKQSTDYHIIFNFFYGDEGSLSLGFPAYGINTDFTGFDYAAGLT